MYILLMLAWLIFNGRITLEIFIFGLAISALVFFFMCRFMGYSIRKEKQLYRMSGWWIRYIFILIIEIIKANLSVISLVTNSRIELEPITVSFKSPVRGNLAKVILANSITLTPGTITVSLDGDDFVVHCLDSSLADGIDSSIFVDELRKIDGKENQ